MINLPEDVRTAIDTALAEDAYYPCVWTTVDETGQPSSSFFGTTQVLSDHEVAIWMRTPSRGFLARIAKNPKCSMLYRNHETKFGFQIHGEARLVEDAATARRVYDKSPEVERNADPDRQGVAVIVDVVRLIQRGQVVQARDAEVGARVD